MEFSVIAVLIYISTRVKSFFHLFEYFSINYHDLLVESTSVEHSNNMEVAGHPAFL